MNARISVVPSGAGLGADILGLDLAKPIDDETFQAILRAWRQHLVLRFRDQSLDEDALIRFSARFGPLDPAPIRPQKVPNHPTRPEINVISNILVDGTPIGGLGNGELIWHQDMTYKALPPRASVLYALEVPDQGGDTHFLDLRRTLETLPTELRGRIEGKRCKHDATRNSAGQLRAGFAETYANADRPGAVHPLIAADPEASRPWLLLGRRPGAWIEGLPDAESEHLLDALWAHVAAESEHWTQQWRVGDVVLWDNLRTLHRRDRLDPSWRRLMHRTQIAGDTPPRA